MRIQEGEILPIGYGFAWRNYNSNTNEVFIIPLNFIIRWARSLWLYLAKPRNYKENRAYLDGYDDGYDRGFEDGESYGRRKERHELGENLAIALKKEKPKADQINEGDSNW